MYFAKNLHVQEDFTKISRVSAEPADRLRKAQIKGHPFVLTVVSKQVLLVKDQYLLNILQCFSRLFNSVRVVGPYIDHQLLE